MPSSVFGVIAPHPPIMVRSVGGARADVTGDSLEALSSVGLAVANYAPETVIVMSPHAPALADAVAVDDASSYSGSFAEFGDPVAHAWRGDPELSRSIIDELRKASVPVVARSESPRLRSGVLDHGCLVPLSFVASSQHFQLIVISLSYLPYAAHRAIGEAASRAADRLSRKAVFLASGDLSHRLTRDAAAGYSPQAEKLDEAIVGLVRQGKLSELSLIDESLVEAGGECGLRSFIALGGYAGQDPVPTRVLSYEGPWGVGYLTALVGEAALEACDTRTLETLERGSKGGSAGADEAEVVVLARRAIESYLRDGNRLADPRLEGEEYPPRAGAFVSLHRSGELRGCIGTILPTRNSLAEEVAANAVEAATRDPRFPPVGEQELEDLEIKVDVLHEPESCSITQLDPKSYGVITSSGWRRGLLLPDLEGVDDVEQQVAIAMSKAGIRPGEPCSYERFKVDRYT